MTRDLERKGEERGEEADSQLFGGRERGKMKRRGRFGGRGGKREEEV